MQADIRQLQELLQDSQDQVSHLQNQQFERNALDESTSSQTSFAADRSLANELPISPNLSRPNISPGLDDGPGRDWSSAYQTSNVMGRLPHTSNDSAASVSTNGSRLHGRRRSQQRTMPSASLRRLGGRAMSVDLTNMMQRKLEDLEFDYQAKATPPGGRSPISPQLRPLALTASVNSLSSSLGAPAYPSPHEDIQEAEESVQEGPTILEIGPSPIKPPHQGESGLSKSSPTKHRRDTISASMAPPLVAAKDASVQTEPLPSAGSLPSYTSSKPSYSQYTPSIMSSDAISEHSSFDHSPHLGHGQSSETLRSGSSRTAALGALMEHVGKLLARLKSADIVSLEARLKKQNLPGDVGYLAKSTMRDIVSAVCKISQLGSADQSIGQRDRSFANAFPPSPGPRSRCSPARNQLTPERVVERKPSGQERLHPACQAIPRHPFRAWPATCYGQQGWPRAPASKQTSRTRRRSIAVRPLDC